MRDRAAERSGGGSLGVDVDPLVVVGGVGEGVHAFLVDGEPLGGAEVFADSAGDLLEAGEGAHHRNLAGFCQDGRVCQDRPHA